MKFLFPTGSSPRRADWRRAWVSALALSVLSLAGCSSAVAERAAGGDGGEGGVLRIGSTNDIVPATVFTNSSDSTNTLIGSVYDSLIDYPLESLEPQPSLATTWKLAKNGRSLTLQLRDDVTFHSGRPFTSKDVEFSIKTWADPVWTVQFQRTAAAVTSFDTSDPHAITLGFDHPLSNIFDLLDVLPIIDSASVDGLRNGEAYVGTGPFVFDSWTPGKGYTLTANKDYWGGAPQLDGVEVDVISDPQAQVAALRAGQVDLVTGASGRDLASLRTDDGFQVKQAEGAEQQIYVGANVANPQLKDARVRQAIAYALDRDRIVKEVYQGVGVATSLPWPTASPAYDAQLAGHYNRDTAKATQLLAKAGDIGTVPLSYPAGNSDYEAVAQIVQANLAEVGIDAELEPVEYTQFIKQLISADFDGLWILSHSYAQYTPSTLTVSAYPFNADKNASHFVSARYQRHADSAWERSNGLGKDAKKGYRQLNRDLIDNAFLLEIAILYPQVAASTSVGPFAWSKRQELQLDDTTVR